MSSGPAQPSETTHYGQALRLQAEHFQCRGLVIKNTFIEECRLDAKSPRRACSVPMGLRLARDPCGVADEELQDVVKMCCVPAKDASCSVSSLAHGHLQSGKEQSPRRLPPHLLAGIPTPSRAPRTRLPAPRPATLAADARSGAAAAAAVAAAEPAPLESSAVTPAPAAPAAPVEAGAGGAGAPAAPSKDSRRWCDAYDEFSLARGRQAESPHGCRSRTSSPASSSTAYSDSDCEDTVDSLDSSPPSLPDEDDWAEEVAAQVRLACPFLRLAGRGLYEERNLHRRKRGVAKCAVFYVYGLPWTKRARWLLPLLWAVASVLKLRGCTAKVQARELYVQVPGPGRGYVRVDFAAARRPNLID